MIRGWVRGMGAGEGTEMGVVMAGRRVRGMVGGVGVVDVGVVLGEGGVGVVGVRGYEWVEGVVGEVGGEGVLGREMGSRSGWVCVGKEGDG